MLCMEGSKEIILCQSLEDSLVGRIHLKINSKRIFVIIFQRVNLKTYESLRELLSISGRKFMHIIYLLQP